MSFSTKNPGEAVQESRFKFTENRELVVEHAAILWTNFSGNPTKYRTDGGRRTFDLVLSGPVAAMLVGEGWNVKTISGRNQDDPTIYVTEIVVNPSAGLGIFLCEEVEGKKTRRRLNPEEYASLDNYQYSDIAVLIHPYCHGRDNSAGTKIKGYLRQMNLVKINDDFFREQFKEYAAGEPVNEMKIDPENDINSDEGWQNAEDYPDCPFR